MNDLEANMIDRDLDEEAKREFVCQQILNCRPGGVIMLPADWNLISNART